MRKKLLCMVVVMVLLVSAMGSTALAHSDNNKEEATRGFYANEYCPECSFFNVVYRVCVGSYQIIQQNCTVHPNCPIRQ